jgi:hypothetical protein
MKQLLSFDVGITNMAYCLANVTDDNKFKIITLSKVNLNSDKSNIQNMIDNTIEFLDDIMSDSSIDINEPLIILIECQMTSIMRTIQTCINTYFKVLSKHQSLDISTTYISPKHKLKLMSTYMTSDTAETTKYKQNKVDSINFTLHLISTVDKFMDNKIIDIIKSHKKKDDICDAYLMCAYYYLTLKI